MNCIDCEHFMGGGDFNLCCSEQYDLCYPYTEACEKFKLTKDKLRKASLLSVKITCPWCNCLYNVNKEAINKVISCPKCHHDVEVKYD